jgi:hypothetical protein
MKLLVNKIEAAQLLGVSLTTFARIARANPKAIGRVRLADTITRYSVEALKKFVRSKGGVC